MTYETTGRTLSAMFDTRAEADAAAAALRDIGATDVVLHGDENPGYGEVRHGDVEERGFFEALGDFFFPDDDRAAYAEGLSRGGYLVTATNVPEHLVQQSLDILDREGAVDLDAREGEWRDDGWSAERYSETYGTSDPAEMRYTREATPGYVEDRGYGEDRAYAEDRAYGTDSLRGDATTDKIDVVEEQINIGKREVDKGAVRVRSYVREVPVSEDVELRDEQVHVQRRPVDRDATGAEFEERTIEARARGEEAVVEKRARVVEEIEINKTADTRTERVEDTVRKTEVEIEGDDSIIGDVRVDKDRI